MPITDIRIGLPPAEFYPKAWSSEPLTNVLTDTNIPYVLPFPDEKLSLVACDEEGTVVGQCSANQVVKYWDHVEKVDTSQQNTSIQIFSSIHKRAVEVEQLYLEEISDSKETSFHSAGIAVVPEYRGRGLGRQMVERQIQLCIQEKGTTLFSETTNRFSAACRAPSQFEEIAKFPYKDLAVELSYPELENVNGGGDAFTVWCKSLKG